MQQITKSQKIWLAANCEHLLKNEGSDIKQDKLQPRGKLLEQALDKLLTWGTSYYKNPLYERRNMTSWKLEGHLLKRQE
jgi:hypothetical protein